MKIFVAYPYRFTEGGYRDALAKRFAGEDVTFMYADERLVNDHVLAKIRKMMCEADTCMFDISGNNPNVMLELGIAIGETHPGFVAVNKPLVTEIGADVVGWDQLRYDSFDDLAEQLHARIGNAAVPTRDVAPVVDPFADEYALDARDFFNPLFVRNGLIGHFDLTVRPVRYKADLIPKAIVRDKMRQFQASYRTRGVSAVPWDVNESKVENFAGGVYLLYQHTEWGRYENARLRTSGLYRIVRIFSEDYTKDGTIRNNDYTLGIVNFIEQVTLLHLLARNIARQILETPDAEVDVMLLIDGLINRRPTIDDPAVDPTYTIGAQNGSERQFKWEGRLSLGSLESDAVTLARKHIEDVFWNFGLRTPIIAAIQRRLLGSSEPAALPPG